MTWEGVNDPEKVKDYYLLLNPAAFHPQSQTAAWPCYVLHMLCYAPGR